MGLLLADQIEANQVLVEVVVMILRLAEQVRRLEL